MDSSGRGGRQPRAEGGTSRRRQLHDMHDRVGGVEERIRRLEQQFAQKVGGDVSLTAWIGKEVLLVDVQGTHHTGKLKWVDKYHIGVQLYGDNSDPSTFTKGNLIKVEPVVR